MIPAFLVFGIVVAAGRFALFSDGEVIVFSDQMRTRKPETTKNDAIYRNATRNRNRGYHAGETAINHQIFRGL